GSRASLLGLTVGSVFFINYNCLKQNSLSTAIRIAITSGVLILALYIAINPEVVELIFSIIGRESTTLSRRDIAWNMLIKQFQSTPFFGVGYRISTEAILVKNNIPISNSHNVYLAVIAETGLIGFIGFILIYATPILYYVLNINKKTINIEVLTSVSILVAFLTNQLFEDTYSAISFFFAYTTFLVYFIGKNLIDANSQKSYYQAQ